LQSADYGRVLCLHAAAKRLQMPERTLRYQASRGRFKAHLKKASCGSFHLQPLRTHKGGDIMRKTGIALGILLAATAMMAAEAGTMAPAFSLADARGAVVDLSGYRGKVVLLNFWATRAAGARLRFPGSRSSRRSTKAGGWRSSAWRWTKTAGSR